MRKVAPDRPGQRREPEQLIGRELEADRRQLGDDDRPHHPDREGEQQRRDRDPEIAPCDGAPGLVPERLVLRPPVLDQIAGPSLPTCCASWIACISGSSGSLRSSGSRASRSMRRIARCIHSSATPDEQEQQHEAARPDAGQIVEHAERDRQHEAAEPADHADEAADRADIVRVIDRDVLVDRGLAQAHEEAEHEDQHDEGARRRFPGGR